MITAPLIRICIIWWSQSLTYPTFGAAPLQSNLGNDYNFMIANLCSYSGERKVRMSTNKEY